MGSLHIFNFSRDKNYTLNFVLIDPQQKTVLKIYSSRMGFYRGSRMEIQVKGGGKKQCKISNLFVYFLQLF